MKKSVVKLLQSFLLLGASILSGFAFYSCGEDAGLGGAIDTKAPSLSIDYPKESGSAIRDQFILAGTVTDDKSIARVTVNVKSLDDGGKISDTYSASFDPVKNRWWVDINRYDASAAGYYNGWQYPDGNYEFSVTAFDNAGNNSGTYSKTFEIDNTAPVFIISNPGVIKKTNLSASAYGSLFTIDGTISDNHTISFMDVTIYDASGKCVSSESYEGENLPYYREEDIATAGGTSVQIAQYSKEPSTALNTRYSQLHESESGTEYYYAEIKLTDSTKVYRNPWGEDARSADEISAEQLGNSTSKVYLYDDVYASLMSAKKGLGLSAANLKDIISGVYSGSASKESVLQTLNEKVYDTSLVEDDPMANKLSFSLNPEANPTYNVNGFEFGFGDEAVLSASSGNTVSVTISAGLDKTNIAPEVVRVWMKTYVQKPTDQAAVKSDLITLGKEVVKFEKYNDDFAGFMDKLHETPENPATTITTGGANWVLIYDYSLNNSRSSSVSTKTFSVTLPDGIELSKYYILGVTGCDIEDLEFAQNTVYGFEGNTAGVPPTIDIETPDNLSVWANFAAPSFSGTASLSTKSLYVSELTASLSIIEDGSTKKNIGEFTDTITCKIENDEKVWSTSAAQALTYDKTEDKWHLDASKLPGLLEVYGKEAPKGVLWLATLKVSGKSSSGHTGEKTLSVKIDTVAPVVSISSVTPTVLGSEYFGDSDTNTYLNGEISIKGNISDTNLLETEAAVTYDVLASIGDEEPVSILADLIANKEDVGADFDGKLGSVYSINESFDTRAISKFFHDFKEKGEDEKIKIEVVVTATDKAGNKGSYSSSLLNGGKNFVIYQETDRPKIELGNAELSITKAENVKVNHNLFGTTSNNKLTVNFSDDDSIAEYEVYVYDEKGELVKETEVSAQTDNVKANPYKYYPGKTTAALSYVLPSKEAKYQVEIKARDYLTTGLNTNPYGEKSVGKFFVAVDSGAPEVEISKPDLNSFQSGSIQVSGSVSKAVDLKGTLVENSQNAAAPKTFEIKSSEMTKDGDSYTWKWENTVANDGAYSIKVDVTDIYGQTAAKTRAFKVDTKSPEIKATTTSVDNNNRLVPLDEMEYITLKADVTDGADSSSVAGISVVKYLLTKDKFSADALKDENIAQIKSAFEGNDWTQMNQGGTVEATNVTSFNASVPVKTFATDKNYFDGEAYVYVATEDNVGNFKISEDPVVLNFDEKAPKIVVVDFDGSTEIETNGIGKATTPDQKLTVKVEDTNVDKLESGDVKLAVGGATELAGGKGKSFVVTPAWEGFLVNGETKYEDTKTATFTATDTHSRKSTKTVILKCDTYAPRVVLTRKTGDTFSNSSSIELTGTIEDKNISGTSEYFKLYLVPPASTSFDVKEGLVTFVKNGEKYEFTANITGLNDTEYNIAIIAKDSFGNEAKYSTDASKTTAKTGSNTDLVTKIDGGSISIDSLAPSSNIKLDTNGKLLDRQKASVTNANPHALDFGSTYYTDNTFILKGTITETNLIENAAQAGGFPGTKEPTLTISKEGVLEAELTPSNDGPFILGANDGNGKYEWSYTPNYDEDGSKDALYEYTLTVWDKSKQSFSKSVTVTLDTKKPELAFTSPSENESFESNPAAKVAYSDDGVGIKEYTYKLFSISDDGTENEKTIETNAITNGSATGSVNLTSAVGSTEGSYKITAQVEDYLGHKSELVERNFYLDTSKPTVDEKAIGSSGLTTNAGTITLTGVVYDTNALYQNGATGTVKISGTWNGQNRSVNVTVTPKAETVDGKSYTAKQYATWTYTFNTANYKGPNNESANTSVENYLPDGTYNFAIIATDTAGKTNQISRTVTVDTVAPKFGTGVASDSNTTNVAPYVSTTSVTSDSEKWYKTNELRFAGTATDTFDGVAGTGIKEVYYETSTDGSSWTRGDYFAGTSSWAGTVQNLVHNSTQVRVVVVDNAGNKTESDPLGKFNIDMVAPTSTIVLTPASGGKLLDSAKNTGASVVFGKTYYTDSTFTLGGTITEENIDPNNPPKLTVSKDGAATTTVNFTTDVTTAGAWTYTIPDFAANNADDGQYVYTLTVNDKIGSDHEFKESITVIVDTKTPDASITAPGDGDQFLATNLPVAKIAYSDDGVGIDTSSSTAIKYIVKNITDSSNVTDVPGTNYSVNNRSATGQATFNSSFNAEGSFTVYAEVEDYLGHKAQTETRTFYYDVAPPTLTETKVGSNGITTNGLEATGGTGTESARKFTLEGTVSDSNALYDNGTYHSTGDNVIVISTNEKLSNGTTRTRTWNIQLESGSTKKSGNWKKDFIIGSGEGVDTDAENYLPDGTYTFSIKATDVAGKTTIEARTVKVDTVAPQFGEEEPSETNTTNVKPHVSTKVSDADWYKTNSLRFEGTASDNGGTGIEKVYYQIGTKNDSGSYTWGDETAFAGTETWAGTVDNLKSQKSMIRIVVIDNAKNKSVVKELGPWKIDMTEPTLTSGSVEVNNAKVSEENPFYSKGAKDGASAVNPVVTFKVSDEENGSGIAKVDVHLYSKATDTTAADVIHITDVAADGSCTAGIPATYITKSGTAYARIYDNAGNATDVNLFALTYDTTDPKIISPVLEEKTANFKAYKTKDNNGKEFYYVNNSDGHKFTLSGVATDNLGLNKITLSITDGTKTLDTVEIVDNPATANKDELADWVFDNIDLHTLSGDNTKVTLTLYDKAGNKAESIISIKYDTDVPAALHELDGSGKDYTFRIGDGIGGKYSPGTYGNNTTIMIRGYFTEPLSGLSMLYYKVLQTQPTQDYADTFLANYTDGSTGFAALSSEKEATVSSSASGDKTVKSNFETTVSSFQEGKNYLLLVAVDNVGNAALDTVSVGTGTDAVTGCYSINVDVKAPEAEASDMNAHLTNGESDIVITGTAKDNPSDGASGIKSIVVSLTIDEQHKYKSSDKNPKITVEPNPAVTTTTDASIANWKATISKDLFADEDLTSGNFTVYATVTDNAGEVKSNSQTSNIGTITVDKKLKKVILNAPADADKTTSVREINGIIDLTGTVEDDNPLSNTAIVGIQYVAAPLDAQNKARAFADLSDAEKSALAWTTLTNSEKTAVHGDMTNLSLSGNYTFSIKNFDTTKIEPLNDVAYYIRAKAQDKAGNIGYSEAIPVTISQDSDRPVIKLTNLTDLGAGSSPRFVLKYGTKSQVIATVDDDDGIAEVYFSETSYTGATGQTAPSTDVSDYSETNGTVTFTPVTANTNAISPDNKNGDGPKGFYIYVKDKADNVFYTMYDTQNGTNYLKVPKVKIGNYHENSADAEPFAYQSDSTSPAVDDIRGLAFKAGASATTAGDVNGGLNNTSKQYTEYEAVNTSYILGGTERQWAQFQVVANDASGIAGIAMEITYTKKDGTKVTKTFSSHNDFKIDANTTVTAADNFKGSGNNATWTTDKVSFADAKSDSVAIKVVPYDKLGLVGNGNVTLMVDNTPPTIKVTSPASGEEKTGSVSFTGTAFDDGNAGTEEIFWLIPKQSDIPDATVAEATKLETLKALTWNGGSSAMPIKATVTSWQFDFDGKYDVATSNTTTHVYKAGNPMLDVYDSDVYAKTITDGVYTLPIYFLAIDKLGNYDIKTDYVILHNPDGDRPKVVFTYPTVSYYDKKAGSTTETEKYVTLGGTIRATGSAEIPSNTTTVKNVYIQIGDLNADGTGTFAASKAAAQATMTSYGFAIVDAYTVINAIKGTEYTSSSTFSDGDLKALGFASKTDLDAWWGIQTNGTASWNIPLNADGKMNPPEATGTTTETTNNISIRACGINADGKMGAWTQQDNVIGIHIDNAAPSLSANVEQFAPAITSATTSEALKALTPSVSQNYESDMYLRGQWYLVVKALDASDINTLKVNGLDPTYKFAVSESVNGKTKKGYKIFIPIDKSGDSASYKVTAIDSDATSHTAEQTFSFKIDNKAPSLESITANGAEFSAINIVQNSNYKFTVAGKSTDEGSGVERVVFYYMRKLGTTPIKSTTNANDVVINPMIQPSGDDYSGAKVSINAGDIEVLTLTQPSETAGGTASTYDLYARKVSGTATTTTFKGTFDAHVRVGGLITFDKTIFRRITAKSSTAVTFEPALTSAPTETETVTAYFPIAQVIDNSATEKTSSDSENPFTFEKGDDGDLMPESFSKTSSTWTWDASIHSDNLPDGPISLVILAFDEAGNVSGTTINTSVSNNAPRVAKLFLATDLNNNKKFEEEEFEEYSIIGAEGKEKDNYVLDFDATDSKGKKKFSAGKFTAKNKLAVVPEIVGGNKSIMLVAKKEADDASTATARAAAAGTQINSIASGTSAGTTVEETTTYSASIAKTDKDAASAYSITAPSFAASAADNKFYAYVLENSVLTGKTAYAEADDGDGKALSFTFWDETEETTQGTDSQKAVVLVKGFSYDLTDGKSPTVVVNPFYWQSLTSNSIYGSDVQDAVSSVNDLQGHIELEDDLPDTFTTSGTGINDLDPKVSGKITFTGTAYDEHSLASISFTFGKGETTTLSGTIATYGYDEEQGISTWKLYDGNSTKSISANGYEASVSVVSTNAKGEKVDTYGVFDDKVYFGQKGHKIYWTLSIDTEKVSKKADTDMTLTVLATDLAGNTTEISGENVIQAPTTSGGYIPGQELTTTVKYTVTDGTTNYPVYKMDVVPYVKSITTSLTSLRRNNPSVFTRSARGHYAVRSNETVTLNGFNLGTNTSVQISTLQKSGIYNPKVNEIEAINNHNANDSHGVYAKTVNLAEKPSGDKTVYANYYNRQPNGDNNNLLTDDIWFDIWEFDNEAAKPTSFHITDAVMKINPRNNMIGFAFANGQFLYCMPNWNTSYTTWQSSFEQYRSVGLAYDSAGYSYGVASGGDNNTHQADLFNFMTSKFGVGTSSGKTGSTGGDKSLRVESIGQMYDDGDGVKENPGTDELYVDKDRIQSPSIATSRPGTGTTNIYLAYYDNINDELRFRSGSLGDPNTEGGTRGKTNIGTITDSFTGNELNIGSSGAKDYNYGFYDPSKAQIVANKSGQGLLGSAGNYVSIGVVKKINQNGQTTNDDVIVMVWYDQWHRKLCFAYNDTPLTERTGVSMAGWTKGPDILDVGGTYCNLAVDADNGIHIAAYSESDLKYAYLSNYKDGTPDVCTVDSYDIVGTNLTIDVAKTGSQNIPYIGYYATSQCLPKYAYLVSDSIQSGSDSVDCFTGKWEITYLPSDTSTRSVPEERINVGVFKTAAGARTYSTTNKAAPTNGNTNIGTKDSGKGNGTCYGNGTDNPVLGYVVKNSSNSSYIETAQMK
ncbi:hypothetical protein [Treponema ruminis]|uniref:Ig-like domain-containing protein n=1 Tax=Treponema ruminis TaxID=744515 RepID=A0A7W8GBI1_9SPIR|nr:hypothetical protein [Treponema ruminis]MBB5227277.1 hypothetical protein [Treponema ruminis]